MCARERTSRVGVHLCWQMLRRLCHDVLQELGISGDQPARDANAMAEGRAKERDEFEWVEAHIAANFLDDAEANGDERVRQKVVAARSQQLNYLLHWLPHAHRDKRRERHTVRMGALAVVELRVAQILGAIPAR